MTAWARVTAVDGVDWAADLLCDEQGDSWMRRDAMPAVDETCRVRLAKDTMSDASRPVWVVFRPARSACNVWEEHLLELALSALAQVVRSTESDRVATGDWAKVRVLDVIPVPDIATRFAATEAHASTPAFALAMAPTVSPSHSGDLTFFMHSQWTLQHERVWAGHRRLTLHEWSRLINAHGDSTSATHATRQARRDL